MQATVQLMPTQKLFCLHMLRCMK